MHSVSTLWNQENKKDRMQASGEESPFFLTCRKREASNGTNSEEDRHFFSVHMFLAVNVIHLGFFDTHK